MFLPCTLLLLAGPAATGAAKMMMYENEEKCSEPHNRGAAGLTRWDGWDGWDGRNFAILLGGMIVLALALLLDQRQTSRQNWANMARNNSDCIHIHSVRGGRQSTGVSEVLCVLSPPWDVYKVSLTFSPSHGIYLHPSALLYATKTKRPNICSV